MNEKASDASKKANVNRCSPSANVAENIISLERSALDRYIRGDPDGYLDLYAKNVTYFDPFREKRVDGLDALRAQLTPIRGMKLPFTSPRYDMINPVVQVDGHVAVLSFNVVNYGTASGSTQEKVLNRWNATEVYSKIDGAWRIIHAHWSFIQPQMAPGSSGQETAPKGEQ